MSARKLSRREVLKGLGVALAGTALAACAPKVVKETVVVEKPVEKVVKETVVVEKPVEKVVKETVIVEKPVEHKPVTIAWWNQFSTATCQEMFPRIVKDFEDLYPWVTVDFEISGGPPGGGEYIEVLLARIAAGNPPDVATLWTPPVQFAARGSLMAIDDFMATAKWAKPGSFYENPLKSCQWRGKTYGLPSSAGASNIFINVAKFEEKGISVKREDFPKKWDDLKALSAEFVVWEGDELKQAGFVPWAAGWTNVVWSALNGGKFFDDKEEKYYLNSDENVAWLDYMVKWLDEQYRGDVETLNMYGGAGGWGDVYPDSGFYLELCPMAESGSWACTDAEIPFKWEVVKYPVGPSGTKSQCAWWPNWWVIPAGAPNPPEAFLFVEYLCTKGWETWYTAVMDTPAWKEFSPNILTLKLVDSVGMEKATEIHKFYADYLEEGAVVMWNSPIEDFANNTVGQAVDEVLHKTKSPREALDEAQKLCQAKLEEVLA